MSRDELLKELRSRDYRRAFVESHARESIAYQLRQMRKRKEWTGKDVAAALGNEKLQPMISRYENPDYGKYTVSTLLQLADVFDVGLLVRFAPFSELVHWDQRVQDEDIVPAEYGKDMWLRVQSEDVLVNELAQTVELGTSVAVKELISDESPQELIRTVGIKEDKSEQHTADTTDRTTAELVGAA
jgi:transcriptional regulator with XRE-family HTH domain